MAVGSVQAVKSFLFFTNLSSKQRLMESNFNFWFILWFGRLKDQGDTKREVKDLEERVDSLTAELKKEKEKNMKKASRDLAEV